MSGASCLGSQWKSEGVARGWWDKNVQDGEEVLLYIGFCDF